jgi:ABC-type multidrug transport system ATPase subunit
MMVTLKKLASMGCTLIFTIYQSSTEVFGLFDRICLLSNGNTLFFGETLSCLQVRDAWNLILPFVSVSIKENNFKMSEAHII